MKIPDILYSGLGWSVVLLSRHERPPPGAVALIELPLAFPYPRARAHTFTNACTHTRPYAAYPTYPYHIFLHIIPLFSRLHLARKGNIKKTEIADVRSCVWARGANDCGKEVVLSIRFGQEGCLTRSLRVVLIM